MQPDMIRTINGNKTYYAIDDMIFFTVRDLLIEANFQKIIPVSFMEVNWSVDFTQAEAVLFFFGLLSSCWIMEKKLSV